MAKTEGTQTVPAEWLDSYRASLGEQRPKLAVHKRVPFRLPNMQAGKSGETAGQRIQRARFKTVIDSFHTLSLAERQRWYAAMPPYSSLLWYYNFFMLSGLMDVLGADARGASVIKSIQNRIISVPLAGTTITHASVIDASKAVVMIWGAGYNQHAEEVSEGVWWAIAWQVYPVWQNLNNTTIDLTWTINPTIAAKVALQVIEYL